MGQKVHPKGLRLGIIKDWDSRWYADKNYRELLHEDILLRDYIKKRLYLSGVSLVEIERAANRLRVSVHTAKPGIVIGRGGTEVEALRKDLEKLSGKQVNVNIVEVMTADNLGDLYDMNLKMASLEGEKKVVFA
jgi:small subunit ribosomal protein S3